MLREWNFESGFFGLHVFKATPKDSAIHGVKDRCRELFWVRLESLLVAGNGLEILGEKVVYALHIRVFVKSVI
jgi:hypothetical protein